MNLRLIAGRAGCGKTRFCLEEIKNAAGKNTGEPLVLLVPEQFSLMAEKSLSAISNEKGMITVRVLSFKRLAHIVFQETGGVKKPAINSAGKAVVLYKSLQKCRPFLEMFSQSSVKTGFIKTAGEMVSEFKRYGISVNDISEMLDGESLKDSLLRQKLYELNLIYDRYENEIKEKYIDNDDELNLLYNKIDESIMFSGARIWIDQFSGFSLQELKIIEKLMITAKEVNVSLCMAEIDSRYEAHEENLLNDIFAPSKITYARLCNLALKNNVKINEPVYLPKAGGRFSKSPMLDHLEENVFSYPYKKYKGTNGEISIFAAKDIYSEIENTARSIITFVRDKGLRYRDITVICSDLDKYERFIKALFSQYEIPVFIDKKREIIKHPVIMLILSVFDIFLYNWSYESVFRYLKTGLTGISREEIDVMENYVLACGIKGWKWYNDKDFDYIPDLLEDEGSKVSYESMLENVNEIRKKIVRPLIDFKNLVNKDSSVTDISAGLYSFLVEIGIPERIEFMTEDFKNRNMLEYAAEYSQVFNIFIESLDVISEMAGDERPGFPGYKEMLFVCLSEYKIGLIPPFVDQVIVGSTNRSINHNPKALLILGANEGYFPVSGKSEGIINDNDRILLYSLGMELAYDTRKEIFQNRFESYVALTAASDHLKLSFPVSGTDGKILRQSPLINRITGIFPGIKRETDVNTNISFESDEIEYISTGQSALSGLYKNLRKEREGFKISPLWHVVKEYFKDKSNEIYSVLDYTNQVVNINDDLTKEIYKSPVHSSVSRLERFSACPFAYFAEYVLKASERSIMDIYLPDIGMYLHAMLEELSVIFNNWDMSGIEYAELSKKVEEVSEKACGKMIGGPIKNGSARHRALIKRLDRILTRSITFLIEHLNRSSFKPLAYEAVFGDRAGLPPITIKITDSMEIKLSGRIDRVDIFVKDNTTYTRVIDYKSGNKDFDLRKIYYGLDLQLITYLDAVSAVAGDKCIPAGMTYFKIDDPMIKTKRNRSEKQIEEDIKKKMRMKGLILDDTEIIRHMDNDISGTSYYLPVAIKKDNTIAASSKVATKEQFECLSIYAKHMIGKLSHRIVSGDIMIEPYKDREKMPCSYCRFRPICGYDETFKDNKPRILEPLDEDRIWQLIYKEIGGE